MLPKLPSVEQCLDPPDDAGGAVELLGDVAVIHASADSFVDLHPRQRVLAFHLSRAAVAADAITWAERTHHGLALKQLVEALASARSSLEEPLRTKVERFAQLVVLHKGVRDIWSGDKLAFDLSFEELRQASAIAHKAGTFAPHVMTPLELDRLLATLRPVLFEAGAAAASPDAKAIADVRRAVVAELRLAREAADGGSRKTIEALITSLEKGDDSAWGGYGSALVDDEAPVQLVMERGLGAPAARRDELGAGLLLLDPAQPEPYAKLAARLPAIASGLPWPKNHSLPALGSKVKAASPLTLTGAFMPAAPDAVTLPLQPRGSTSKTFVLTSSSQPANRLVTDAVVRGFLPDPAQQGDARECLPPVWGALSVLRHVVGHGVGRFAEGPAGQLGELEGVLQEARADLIALHAARDAAVVDAGLLPARCVRFVPVAYSVRFLLSLLNADEQSRLWHARAQAEALVVHRLLDQGALREVRRENSVVLAITDEARWNAQTDALLREVLRVEAAADVQGAKLLAEKALAPVPSAWRDSVRAKAAELRLPRGVVVVTPRLKPLRDEKGAITDATIVDSLSLLETALADAGKLQLP